MRKCLVHYHDYSNSFLDINTLKVAKATWVPLIPSTCEAEVDLCEFETSLVYIVSFRTARAMKRDPISKTKWNEIHSSKVTKVHTLQCEHHHFSYWNFKMQQWVIVTLSKQFKLKTKPKQTKPNKQKPKITKTKLFFKKKTLRNWGIYDPSTQDTELVGSWISGW